MSVKRGKNVRKRADLILKTKLFEVTRACNNKDSHKNLTYNEFIESLKITI